MCKKYLSLTFVLLLIMPSIVEAKSMFEENFEHEQKELKSEGRALAMSLAATVTPLLLGGAFLSGDSEDIGLCIALGGLVAGPSLGHFYAKQTGRGLKGIGIRAAIVVGGAYLISSKTEELHPDCRVMAFGYGVLAAGTLIFIHGMYDTFTAPSSVRKYNKSLMEENSLRLVPEINLVNESYGLSIVYNF